MSRAKKFYNTGRKKTRALHEMLPLPDEYDVWAVPDFCKMLGLPTPETAGDGWCAVDRTHAVLSADATYLATAPSNMVPQGIQAVEKPVHDKYGLRPCT